MDIIREKRQHKKFRRNRLDIELEIDTTDRIDKRKQEYKRARLNIKDIEYTDEE